MSDWLQTLMSGFDRAVQNAGANQRPQEQQAQETVTAGQSLSGIAGVAAALGSVAANAGSTNTQDLRPETGPAQPPTFRAICLPGREFAGFYVRVVDETDEMSIA